jgi:hypothetical protein
MHQHELTRFENNVKELHGHLTHLADTAGFDEFVSIIHRPGFTTPAETLLFGAVVDSMLQHSQTLLGLKQALLSAAAKVELNPQPLPPGGELTGKATAV